MRKSKLEVFVPEKLRTMTDQEARVKMTGLIANDSIYYAALKELRAMADRLRTVNR